MDRRDMTFEPIGKEQILELTQILQRYKAGKAATERRIIASENWWKLRNTREEGRFDTLNGYSSSSAWLHNVITSKHADAMANFPEANIRARERGDVREAKLLKSIIPCILDLNDFEKTYRLYQWTKLKSGTGAVKVVWDKDKLNGLGDISIVPVNLLDVYWEPGVTDIQKSRYLFHVELADRDALADAYPQLADKIKSDTMITSQYQYDDAIDTSNKVSVIECYYHRRVGGKSVLHYVKYVADEVLYASENDPELAERGFYDHGLYPYVLDVLFPIEGSPCGYGYVDLCRNPQTTIDLLNTVFVRNAMTGATPRFFQRADGSINEEEFLDLSKPIVHVTGNLGEDSIRQINFNSLDGVYVTLRDQTIQELRETSGNTETSTGSVSSGVTAASAIAALQEASGKGSRDSTAASYNAYEDIVYLCIELIRQFYDLPRQFRITGDMGQDEYITYTNSGIQPEPQGNDFGLDMGFRVPEFDIRATAQKKSAYSKVTQNELALQFYNLGFFDPSRTDMALACLQMMDFDGREDVMQMISQNGTIYQQAAQFGQMALMLAGKFAPDLVPGLSNAMMQFTGGQTAPTKGEPIKLSAEKAESGITRNAREKAQNSTAPSGGAVTAEANG